MESLGEDRLLAYSFVLAAVGFALVPLFHDIALLALVAFVFGLGTGCGQPLATMMMFGHAVEGRSGEALGLRLTVNNLMRVVRTGCVRRRRVGLWLAARVLPQRSHDGRRRPRQPSKAR